ncbi:hypothetical protein F2P81_015861 [Scophthalmus maximus]|uniref:Uncharacterized protein n=1 Tax=Scophthalmus maximus TaxID=52904 RepID=A0A6A4S7X5_SCOMX|nr:hypothetical protein F2P81_015861 [Scophthalmus maximus]
MITTTSALESTEIPVIQNGRSLILILPASRCAANKRDDPAAARGLETTNGSRATGFPNKVQDGPSTGRDELPQLQFPLMNIPVARRHVASKFKMIKMTSSPTARQQGGVIDAPPLAVKGPDETQTQDQCSSVGRSVCASSACCGVFYVADRVRLLMWVLRPVFEKQRAASCRTRAAVNGAAELQETKSTNAKLLDGPPSWSVWSTMDVLVSLEHDGRPGQSGARWTSWSVWRMTDVLMRT